MLTARLATAVVLLAFSISALWWLPNAWWTGLLLPVLAAASWEWGALAGFTRKARLTFSAIVLASALLLWLRGEGRHTLDALVYGMSCAFWVLLAPAWLALRWRVRAPLVLGIAGWIVLLPAWLALARLQAQPSQLLTLLGVVWVADTAAYLTGSAWGRHALAPAISPGKTWEGVAGAAAAVAVYYGLLSGVTPEWPWWENASGAVLFAGVALLSMVGDLFESWIKRQAGVKDSGTLLPGHGGILDRVDSMTSSMPFAAALLLYIG